MSGTIKRPLIKSVDFCVDENIWGHRLYDEQLPHLTVLEFLGVLGSNLDKPLRPHTGLGGAVQFKPQRQMRLRGLLFNNPYVESISQSKLADEEKWRQWLSKFEQGSTGNGDGAADLAYLRQSFNSFDDFAKAIELLRSSSFESRSNKRWSSKFVFPFGPDALYEDLQIDAKGNMSNDRRFFARTGELLYLMLTRASRGPELGDLLAKRLFERSAPMNRLARALQGAPQLPEDSRLSGYLPELSNPRFDQMCEDWHAILSRDIPVYDALEHLTFGFLCQGRIACAALQQLATTFRKFDALAHLESVVIGNDNLGTAHVVQHVAGQQFSVFVIAVGVVGLQNPQAVFDG